MSEIQKDKSGWPESFDLLPGAALVRKAGEFLGSLLVPFHCEAEPYMSEHYRGGAAMLDRELYDGGAVENI